MTFPVGSKVVYRPEEDTACPLLVGYTEIIGTVKYSPPYYLHTIELTDIENYSGGTKWFCDIRYCYLLDESPAQELVRKAVDLHEFAKYCKAKQRAMQVANRHGENGSENRS